MKKKNERSLSDSPDGRGCRPFWAHRRLLNGERSQLKHHSLSKWHRWSSFGRRWQPLRQGWSLSSKSLDHRRCVGCQFHQKCWNPNQNCPFQGWFLHNPKRIHRLHSPVRNLKNEIIHLYIPWLPSTTYVFVYDQTGRQVGLNLLENTKYFLLEMYNTWKTCNDPVKTI